MGCAAALQGGCEQRGLLDFREGVEGVDLPVDGVGVVVPEALVAFVVVEETSSEWMAAVMSLAAAGASVEAVPPRSGERRWSVEDAWRFKSARVLDGAR